MVVRLLDIHAGSALLAETFWYSFLLETEASRAGIALSV
jgi:hypothetical protein